MPIRVKPKEYEVALDRAGRMTADGEELLQTGPGWTPEHLVLAAVAHCGINSLTWFAGKDGIAVAAEAKATGVIARREDARNAFVDIECHLEVELTPPPDETKLPGLLLRAERGCYVGNSLDPHPQYSWVVNGREIS
jgi:organic hydroperoxide reductase OsmC/OhrA